jgi:hypothetical protein
MNFQYFSFTDASYIEHDYQQSPSDEILPLSYSTDVLPKDYDHNVRLLMKKKKIFIGIGHKRGSFFYILCEGLILTKKDCISRQKT